MKCFTAKDAKEDRDRSQELALRRNSGIELQFLCVLGALGVLCGERNLVSTRQRDLRLRG